MIMGSAGDNGVLIKYLKTVKLWSRVNVKIRIFLCGNVFICMPMTPRST